MISDQKENTNNLVNSGQGLERKVDNTERSGSAEWMRKLAIQMKKRKAQKKNSTRKWRWGNGNEVFQTQIKSTVGSTIGRFDQPEERQSEMKDKPEGKLHQYINKKTK